MSFFKKAKPNLDDIYNMAQKKLLGYIDKKAKKNKSNPSESLYFSKLNEKSSKEDICKALQNELDREKKYAESLIKGKMNSDRVIFDYHSNIELLFKEAKDRIVEYDKRQPLFHGKSTMRKYLDEMIVKCQKINKPMLKKRNEEKLREMRIYVVSLPSNQKIGKNYTSQNKDVVAEVGNVAGGLAMVAGTAVALMGGSSADGIITSATGLMR